MARPVVVVVDAEDASRQALTRELEGRYGADYRIMSSASPEEALAGLEQLRGEGADVPLVLTDQWMPARAGAQFLARVRELYPAARRVLLISWGDPAPIVEAAALGQIDFYLPKPVWSPDEQFHRAITESLAEWWRQQGGQFAAVTVIGAEPSARVHEIRDLLARNNIPFGFQRADSEEGSAALQRLGLDPSSGPVVTFYTGVVLADPANAQVAEALGVSIRPAETTYDLVVVGAGPAGLAAAVYGASEGLRTALLEREAFGGQAGTSSLIRNYLGFPPRDKRRRTSRAGLRAGLDVRNAVRLRQPGPAPVEICAARHDPHPLGVPGREHVPVPDPRDRSRAQHRSPLPHRGHRRRRRWTPRAAQPPAPGHRRNRNSAGRRAVRPDRRPAIHRLAARGGPARPVGLHPYRPGPG